MRGVRTGLVIAVLAVGHAQAQNAGDVQALQGGANVTRGNAAAAALAQGAAIQRNDIVETADNGKLLIGFVDGTKLTLGPSADVVIDEYVYNPNGGANAAAIRVASGAMRLVAGAVERAGGPQAITVKTAVGTIGIRGTDFFVEMEDDHLSVALFSGHEVVVSNASGTTTLRPGEGTDIWGGKAPSQAITWGYDRVNRALGLVTVAGIDTRPLPYARPVATAETLGEALIGGKFKIDGRLRYEFVDHASQAQTSYALTGRLRVGYETLSWNGLFGGVEGEVTHHLAARRSDGVVNVAALPVIPDPDSETLNQLYGGWTHAGADGMTGTRLVVGRQRIAYENERWVGPGNFRQNDQTFDAAAFEARVVPELSVRYAYVNRINRILGNNPNGTWDSNSHFVGVSTTVVPFGVTTAYAYLLDLTPVPQFSSATYGARYDALYENGPFAFGLEAEAARQTNYAANPRNYAVAYALIRPSLRWNDSTLYAGWENLGSNGVAALQTPLATLHRHNGWADVFLTTPVNGLRDLHVRFFQELPDFGPMKTPKLDVRFHDFSAAHGGVHYGTEFDFDLNATVFSRVTTGLRFASYNADKFDSDTKKVWAYLEFQY